MKFKCLIVILICFLFMQCSMDQSSKKNILATNNINKAQISTGLQNSMGLELLFNDNVLDSSQQNNNAILYGGNPPVFADGINSRCLSFNGQYQSSVKISNSNSVNFGTGDFSISVLAKTSKDGGVFSVKQDYSGGGSYIFDITSGGPSLSVSDGINNASFRAAKILNSDGSYQVAKINDNNWHNIVVTVSRANGVLFYIDNILVPYTINCYIYNVGVVPITQVTGNISNSGELYIGNLLTSGQGFVGLMDNVLFFNKVLTTTDISELYNNSNPGTLPQPPSNLYASGITTNGFSVSWSSSADATNYNVYLNNVFQTTTVSNSYTFNGLTSGMSYQISITAINVVGESGKSDINISTLSATTPDPIPPKGKWLFDGNVNDGSGNNANCLIIGAPSYVSSPFGQAFAFNGSNFIEILNCTDFNNMQSFAIEAWIYPTSYSYCDPIVSKVNPNRDFVFQLDSYGKLNVHFAINYNVYYHCYGSNTIPLNQWSHVAVIWTGTKWQLFYNGNKVGERDCGINVPAWTGTKMGIGTMNYQYNFLGNMDEIKIFSGVVTPEMIYNDWASGNAILHP
jgi:hypothetical protein